MILWRLFLSFLKIGAFSFGGGYAMVPLLQEELVTRHGWFTARDLINTLALSQMTPGPVAINSATLVGFKMAGVPGATAATLAVVLVPSLLVLVLARFIQLFEEKPVVQGTLRGIRPVVISLIIAAVVFVWRGSIVDFQGALIALGVLVALRRGVHPILALLAAGAAGMFLY